MMGRLIRLRIPYPQTYPQIGAGPFPASRAPRAREILAETQQENDMEALALAFGAAMMAGIYGLVVWGWNKIRRKPQQDDD